MMIAPSLALAADDEAPKGPKYFDLRYNDDFSYLGGDKGSYQEDFADPIKWIRLNDDWHLTVGGEFRFRLESETNKNFGGTQRSNDVFQLYRFLVNLDLKYRDAFRVFVQGIEAFDEDRDFADRPTDQNHLDLQQAFFDLKLLDACSLTLRVGRQELQYGNERYVSATEWDSVRRRFDAVKLFAHGDTWDMDLWYAKPVVVKRASFDDWNEELDFYGLYTTYKGIPNHGLDLYFMAIDDTGVPFNPNFRAGDRDTYMFGSRFWGKASNFDYEAELAGQWGHWGGDSVQGWSWSVYGGYTFECPWKPRIGAGFDWASGDDKANDRSVGTFNQLFPNGHAHFGAMDLVGRQNITAANVGLSMWPVQDKVKTALTYWAFWLTEERDALYGADGRPARRDVFGNSGQEVGNELDWTLSWQVDVHSSLVFGWSHFWDDNYIVASGPDDDGDFLYMQYQFKF